MKLSGKKVSAVTGIIIGCIAVSACSNAPQSNLANAPVPEKRPGQGIAVLDEASQQEASTKVAALDPQSQKAHTSDKTKFSSRQFGVEGSPRITKDMIVRKGGGYYHVGKPYVIRGKRYVPKEDPNYKVVGLASWYGPNFHGRLTANGEVYDQYGMSAAHPTMPLPSYARVTNLDNGSSVLVRVNDRGPFSKNRVIDLSSRAAQLLGYTKKGIAKVKVEYAGKAKLDGLDEPFLLSSYNPGSLDPALIPHNPRGEFEVAYASKTESKTGNRISLDAINKTTGNTAAATKTRSRLPGHPVDVSGLRTPRPSGLVNGYLPEKEHSGLAAINTLQTAQPILPPEQGMGQLSRFVVGPIIQAERVAHLESRASRFGPVGWIIDDTTKHHFMMMSFDRSDEPEVRKFLDKNGLRTVSK